MNTNIGAKKSLIIFMSLIALVILFVILRPQGITKLPINESDKPTMNMSGVTNVKSFSDMKKNTTSKSNIVITPTIKRTNRESKPLPYPRISINYSVKTTRSIGDNKLDKNSTFVIVALDIRNHGYTYFDAHQSKFRMGKNGELRPLTNISSGKTIDAVLPNGSRVRGTLVFLLGKSVNQGTLTYVSENKSENYNILYKKLSQSQMGESRRDVSNDEDL